MSACDCCVLPRALLTSHTLFLMEKLVATKSSKQIPSIWTAHAKGSKFRTHTCAEYTGSSFLRVPDVDALTCPPNGSSDSAGGRQCAIIAGYVRVSAV